MLCRLSIITYTGLHSFCKIEAHPSIASALVGFQQAPLGCALAVCLFHNRESSDSRIFPGLSMVSAGAFPDVQVGDGYPHQVRPECRCFGIYRFPGLIKHGISRIIIRTFLRILQRLERPFLRGCVCPGLADAVPDLRSCRAGGCTSMQSPPGELIQMVMGPLPAKSSSLNIAGVISSSNQLSSAIVPYSSRTLSADGSSSV